MNEKKALVVNLFGAPGTGKSTAAAYIFAKLKMDYINAELVTEFAKDKTYERNDMVLANQFYVFGKQAFRLDRVVNQVDVVITDSPLLLSNYYAGNDPAMENFKRACVDLFKSYDNLNFFLRRAKPYNPVGRSQTESESDLIALRLVRMLDNEDIDYSIFKGCQEDYDRIYEKVKEELYLREHQKA